MSGLFARLSQRLLAPQTAARPVAGLFGAARGESLEPSDEPNPAQRTGRGSAGSPIVPARSASVPRSAQMASTALEPSAGGPQGQPTARVPDDVRRNDEATDALPDTVEADARTQRLVPQVARAERETPEEYSASTRSAAAESPFPEPRRQNSGPPNVHRVVHPRESQFPDSLGLAGRERGAAKDRGEQPVIHVSIDRIDVHQPPVARPRETPARPVSSLLSLQDYLRGERRR